MGFNSVLKGLIINKKFYGNLFGKSGDTNGPIDGHDIVFINKLCTVRLLIA